MLVILLLVLMVAPLIIGLYRLADAICESKDVLREKIAEFLGRTSHRSKEEDTEPKRFMPNTQKTNGFHGGLEVRNIPLGSSASICLRCYPGKGFVKGVLILYGKHKKGSPPFYELGTVETKQCSPEVLSHFAKLGKERLELLGGLGKRQRLTKVKEKQVIPEFPLVSEIPVPQPEEGAEFKNEALQVKAKQMVVYRGEILVIGLLPKICDGKTNMVHGVKLRTEDGREQCCYGRHLKKAIEIARVQIGDFVEIAKVGRRTITEGKAPMNLWEVRKLSSVPA
jgi:hypothetical protein